MNVGTYIIRDVVIYKFRKKILIAIGILTISFVIFLMTVGAIISGFAAIFSSTNDSTTDVINSEGLPQFITQEMIIASLSEQEATGYPASVTLAQIIQESGYGVFGPGGDVGQGLSGLAYNYKNLFGMKAPAGDSTPIGVVNMQTGEEISGSQVTVRAGFLIFRNYTDCIKYRSGLISRVYSDLIGGVTDPDTFAHRLGSRWATDSNYGNRLVSIMRSYRLYRFNDGNIDINGTINGTEDGSISPGQRRIQEIALSGSSLGLSTGYCQAWVANVYNRAGQSPRQSRACATEAGNAFLVSSSRQNIPIGAAVYGAHSTGNARCGNHDAGHVGIYVGNGKIASLERGVTVKAMDRWISTYGWRGWGWNGNEDFSRR